MSTAVTALNFFLRPLHIMRAYRRENLGPDLVAGLTVATIALPQAMAYAFIAELPPQVGLYTAIVGSIVGGLWGSSDHLQTGPTNAASLLVLSVLLPLDVPGTPDYMARAGLLALMVGLVRMGLGLARLGKLADFVSDSVVVGFTAGAGLLIFFNQLRHLLRLDLPSTARLDQTLVNIAQALPTLHWPSLLVGLGAVAVTLLAPRLHRRLPGTLVSIVAAAAVVGLARLDRLGVKVVGAFPPGLPAMARLPLLDWDALGQLSTGALAIAAIGLVEAMSVARTIAGETGQRIESNQEFVGQGLASIACGLWSGYVCSGSPARSMVSYYAGARSALASVLGGLFVLLATLVLAPLASFIPLAALAGVVMLVARRLINDREMCRIWRGPGGDRLIMVVTLLATLALPLEYAVLSGIAVSLAHYLLKTSTPRVRPVLPDDSFEHFVPQLDRPSCPQLEIIEVLGDLYFGSVNHIEDRIRAYLERTPGRRFLLLRMHSVENCDISGIHMLERVVRSCREAHGDVFMVKVQRPVLDVMRSAGFLKLLQFSRLLDENEAIQQLFYHVLDPSICIYECPVRVFRECQNLPKKLLPEGIDCHIEQVGDHAPTIQPQALWGALHAANPPLVIDVREPREFKRGHIAQARLIPLPSLLAEVSQVPAGPKLVLVCRGGRRSSRAAGYLIRQDYPNVAVLKGGMLAWEAANLLEAVDIG